jgi:NAD(P)-dependent dehydrogenase (short-subunit alcohol dehydrogenase family)
MKITVRRYGVTVALVWLITTGVITLIQPASAETVLITGANSGIGLEFTKQYARKGWTIIATHRRSRIPESLSEVAAGYTNLRIERMDVTVPAEVKALALKLRDVAVDVLINNAGVYNDRSACREEDCPGDWNTQSFGNLDYALLDTIMSVNVKGPLMVSEAFLENVRSSRQKKLISISSTNGSLTEQLPGSGAIFYRASKAALNRAMQLVAAANRDDGVIVVLLHPGAVLTERQAYLAGYKGMMELPVTVKQMIETIDSLTIQDTGRFMLYDGSTAPW